MDTLAQLREVKERAFAANDLAECKVIGLARAIVDERRNPAFVNVPTKARTMLDGLLDQLADAVDAQRAAFVVLEKAQQAVVDAYQQQLGRIA